MSMTDTAQAAETTSRDWWATEPAPVAAVIDLANLADRGRIVGLLAPQHADTLDMIADELATIDRLTWDTPSDVLSDYYDRAVHGSDLDVECDELAEKLRENVRLMAQFLASLITASRAA